MNVLYFVLFLLAVVCFVAAASERVSSRFNLVALGLALATAVFALQQLAKL